MELTIAQLSLPGPVRANNEDFLSFWQPEGLDELRSRGAIAVLADGVGGQANGEVASQLAVETAIQQFKGSSLKFAPGQLLFDIFNRANTAVYDAGMKTRGQGRMATTLTVALFRNNELTIGHVGDCRAYLFQQGRLRRLTTDHSYVGLQLKLGLITEQEAMASEHRSILTRSLGRDLTVQVDLYNVNVHRDDVLLQCCDGIHAYVTESEMSEVLSRLPPEEACRELTALAEKRGTDDNLSVQVIRVNRVEQMIYYRGVPIYQEAPDHSMSHEIQLGQVLDDRFHITDVISRSGMASIFKARDLKTGQVVALKVPFMEFESDPGFYSRFEREEAIGKALNHPCILRILPIEEPKSRPYIAMELLEGETLRQLMRTFRPVPEAEALRIGSRLCEALDYLHKNQIVHRDLKPENIMLCKDGSMRVMDFGIAKAAGMRRLTFSGFSPTMGTPDYMAPEQVKGNRGDERTDIYSLGAILYEMLTGQAPFEGANPYVIMNARLGGDPAAPRKINRDLSPQAEEIVLHALEENPANRYSSAAELKAELDNPSSVHLTGRQERLRPPTVGKGRWQQTHLIVIAILAPFAVFGLLALGFLFASVRR